jgi:hypothetical protein
MGLLVNLQELTHVTGRLSNICADRDSGLEYRP